MLTCVSSTAAVPHLSVAEYFALEATSDVRHEFVGGQLYAMVGGTRRHNLISGRVFRAVSEGLKDGCYAYVSDMKLSVAGDVFYYPDVMVVCEPSADERFETSPCLIVEVLSPSTAGVDRREKLAAYLTIPTMRAYLIVDPLQPHVEAHEHHHERWSTIHYGAGDAIALVCPPMTLDVDELYANLP
jgi:Uma2 family endonuclease